MENGDTRQPVKNSLVYSVKDGCASAVMIGMGELNFCAYAVFLSVSPIVLSLIASLPLMVGSICQVCSLLILNKIQFRKQFIVKSVLIQASSFIPLIILPVLFEWNFNSSVIFVVIMYFSFGHLCLPAWNSWIGELVDPEGRGEFFAKRAKYIGLYHLCSILCAGIILDLFKKNGLEWCGFCVVFSIAALSRLVSAFYISRMTELQFVKPSNEDKSSLKEFVQAGMSSNFFRFTVFISLMLATTCIAGPFFSVYMLRDLNYSYMEFTAIQISIVLAQIITLSRWGKVCDKYGNVTVLKFTTKLIPICPMLWLVSSDVFYLFCVQLFSGTIWSGFNLSFGNFIFDAVEPRKRARYFAYFNLFANSGILIGSVLGGLISEYLPKHIIIAGYSIEFISHWTFLFLISGLIRIPVVILFVNKVKEVRKVVTVSNTEIALYLLGLRSMPGSS